MVCALCPTLATIKHILTLSYKTSLTQGTQPGPEKAKEMITNYCPLSITNRARPMAFIQSGETNNDKK